MLKKRIADIVVETLIECGVTDAFSVVGGGAMHLNNAFVLAKDNIKTVYEHHEQACSMAAESYARLSGRPACVCVTSGPGGLNALNGVQGAWVDSIPMIIISGHPRYATTVAATNGLIIRTRGVQENDIVYMVKKITKYAKLIIDPLEVRAEIKKAIKIAVSGRRGPVWIDIPLDVQGTYIDDSELYEYELDEQNIKEKANLSASLDILFDKLEESERPCFLTGSGIRAGGAWELYKKMIDRIKIPIVGGALQADINTVNDDHYYGMSGSIGPRCGNFILQNADLIIVLGNSLSFKQTGFNQSAFAPKAKIIMVDADRDEARKPGLHVEEVIETSLDLFFSEVISSGKLFVASQKWVEYCNRLKIDFPEYEILNKTEIFDDERVPAVLFWKRFLENEVNMNAVFCLGNSSSIVGILQEGIKIEGQRVLVNYNAGSMGDDITEAIGAAICDRERIVYAITGDGSIMMNLQELQTIKHYNLNIKTIIFNNNGYGAIRATCSRYFNGVYTGCDRQSGISFPDFMKIADAFDVKYRKCCSVGELNEAIDWVVNEDGPLILEIMQRIEEIPGFRLESIMNDKGEFDTAPLHDLSPRLGEETLKKYEYQ